MNNTFKKFSLGLCFFLFFNFSEKTLSSLHLSPIRALSGGVPGPSVLKIASGSKKNTTSFNNLSVGDHSSIDTGHTGYLPLLPQGDNHFSNLSDHHFQNPHAPSKNKGHHQSFSSGHFQNSLPEDSYGGKKSIKKKNFTRSKEKFLGTLSQEKQSNSQIKEFSVKSPKALKKDFIRLAVDEKPSSMENPFLRTKKSLEALKKSSPFDGQWGPKEDRQQWLEASVRLLEPDTGAITQEAINNLQEGFDSLLSTIEKVPDPRVVMAVEGVKAVEKILQSLLGAIKSNGLEKSLKIKFMNADVQFRHINSHFFALLMSITELEALKKHLENKELTEDVMKSIKEKISFLENRLRTLCHSLYDSYGWITGSKGNIFEPKWYNTLSRDKQLLLMYVMDYGLNFSPQKSTLIKEPVYKKFLDLPFRNKEEVVRGLRKGAGQLIGTIVGGKTSV